MTVGRVQHGRRPPRIDNEIHQPATLRAAARRGNARLPRSKSRAWIVDRLGFPPPKDLTLLAMVLNSVGVELDEGTEGLGEP
jgi:hypothetical protein